MRLLCFTLLALLYILQDKLSGESHQVTSQELRINTQKSRIEELENMLSVSAEQQNLLRKQSMLHLDKQDTLRKELDKSHGDYNQILKKLAEAEARLTESDRRVEELVDNQVSCLSIYLQSVLLILLPSEQAVGGVLPDGDQHEEPELGHAAAVRRQQVQLARAQELRSPAISLQQ